ncbi:MAG: CocE/NonD family hydrolase, partial [Ignavibacteriales bacterium]|nr:CocE/NonD family hydrolase [Ignavibacteriales bacterium]
MYRFIYLSVLFLTNVTFALTTNPDSLWFAQHYYKQEFRIPMRDGKLLFTAVYIPKDTTETHPIRITRTPYTCAPYGENNFLVPQHLNLKYAKENYIMVWQDVRGRFMSEGNFRDMTPYIPQKTDSSMVDESSDAFDTIEWLIKHIPYNNGKAGIWGSSYPGFYTIMAAIDAHPNLVAVVPQAPIADWFVGDDMHHNGAFTLQMAFNFFSVFGIPRDTLTTVWPSSFTAPSPDAYSFFLSLGAVKNANTRFFHHNIPIWEDLLTHGNYDEYWRKRQTLQHIKNIKPAMLLVGGWYDAEDFYGTINTYRAIRKNSKETHTNLIIGPWAHSTWNTVTGDRLGDFSFSSATAEYYRDSIE